MYKITTLHTVDYVPTMNAVRAWAEDSFGSEIDVGIPDGPLRMGQKFQVGFTVERVPDSDYYGITTPEQFWAANLTDGDAIAADSDDGFDIGEIETHDDGTFSVHWLGAAVTMRYTIDGPTGTGVHGVDALLPCKEFPSVADAKQFAWW